MLEIKFEILNNVFIINSIYYKYLLCKNISLIYIFAMYNFSGACMTYIKYLHITNLYIIYLNIKF